MAFPDRLLQVLHVTEQASNRLVLLHYEGLLLFHVISRHGVLHSPWLLLRSQSPRPVLQETTPKVKQNPAARASISDANVTIDVLQMLQVAPHSVHEIHATVGRNSHVQLVDKLQHPSALVVDSMSEFLNANIVAILLIIRVLCVHGSVIIRDLDVSTLVNVLPLEIIYALLAD